MSPIFGVSTCKWYRRKAGDLGYPLPAHNRIVQKKLETDGKKRKKTYKNNMLQNFFLIHNYYLGRVGPAIASSTYENTDH